MLNFFFDMDFSAVPASTINGSMLLPFMLLGIIVVVFLGKKNNWGVVKTLFNLAFVLYLFVLVEVFFFSIPFKPSEIIAAREFSHPRMNLVPLREMLSAPLPIIIRNFIGNIALFVPLGFFLPIYIQGKQRIKKSIAIVFASSLCVEAIQYIGSFIVFKLDWKIVDIDDVIMNVIGGMIGILIYFFVSYISKIQLGNSELRS